MKHPAAWWAGALEHQEHRDARAPGRTWDLRLVPAALGAWLTGLLAGRLSPERAAAGGALYLMALVLGPALVLAAARGLRREEPPLGRHGAPGAWRAVPWSAVALSTLAVAAVLLSSTAARHDTTHGPLGEALARGGTLAVTAEVAEPPRRWAAPAPGAAHEDEDRAGVVLQLRLDHVTHRGRGGSVDVTATVFADGPAWAALVPGQRITALLTAGPPEPGPPVLRAAAPPAHLPAEEPGRREQVRERFVLATAGLGPDAAGLLPGMTFGERSGIGPELDQAMRDTGLTHLTAVSGANCALVTALAGHAALSLGAGRRSCLTVGLGALAAFVLLVGPDPSVLRAAVMGGLAALSLLTGRTAVSLATLSGAVIVLVVVRPALAAEYGFVLSVLATAGIVVSGRPLTRWLGTRVPDVLAVAVAIPAAAQLWCAPVLVLLQPAVPVYSLPANVLAAPLVPAVTVCGLAGLLLLSLPDGTGAAAAVLPLGAGAMAARLVAGTARSLAGAPGALAPWPEGPPGVLLMVLASAAALLTVHALDVRRRRPAPTAGTLRADPAPAPVPEEHWRAQARRRRRRRTAASAAVLLLVVLLAVRAAVDARRPPPAWEAVVCDVGQGDAVLLRTGPGRAVLVDTGPEPRALERCLRRSGVEHLDLVVLSHAHADHTGGLPALARHGRIDEVWYATAAAGPPEELTRSLPGTPARRPPPGETRTLGGLRLTVLAPEPTAPGRWSDPSSSDENNASLVLRAELTGPDSGTTSWLLAGDLEEEGARALVRTAGPLLDVDVLKVSHHGARNGGTAIIDAASPGLAVVSAGRDNDYGHPHPRIVSHLRGRGVPLVRTDEHGGAYLLREGGHLRAVPADP
ncbi:ComEC/Rec2 family competence protein [uncultured Kocuria sp.]|uniref:ComEC/Rec2 family competence protein n=1 Tax=uncultured Kocuria sp. TaxID=259305 RepID=UPI00261D6C4C|nr:ComEC/Rec2 family competence protein [uncultured Kocuria sp.]